MVVATDDDEVDRAEVVVEDGKVSSLVDTSTADASVDLANAAVALVGPSVASNVHVSGQLINTTHSHGNGNVTNISPGVKLDVSSKIVVSHVPQLASSTTIGSHGTGVLIKSAMGQVTFPIPVKLTKPVTGGNVGNVSLKYSQESEQPSARTHSQCSGKYAI